MISITLCEVCGCESFREIHSPVLSCLGQFQNRKAHLVLPSVHTHSVGKSYQSLICTAANSWLYISAFQFITTKFPMRELSTVSGTINRKTQSDWIIAFNIKSVYVLYSFSFFWLGRGFIYKHNKTKVKSVVFHIKQNSQIFGLFWQQKLLESRQSQGCYMEIQLSISYFSDTSFRMRSNLDFMYRGMESGSEIFIIKTLD